MASIRIAWDSGEVIVDLRDTPTARALIASFPVRRSPPQYRILRRGPRLGSL
jgi:hypothetical protein